jgi:integrase/recombinase XerD
MAPTPIGNPTDPNSLYHYMLRFLAWLTERNYTERTVNGHEEYLRYFIQWSDERGLLQPQEITKPILERYQRHLFLYRKANGQPLTNGTQRNRLTSIRTYFKWLTQSNYLLYNPASELTLPRKEHCLPQAVLTAQEAEQVLIQPDLRTCS